MTPVLTGIFIWYILITVFFLLALFNNNFIYVKSKDMFLNTRRGSTIVYLLSSTTILLTPIITEPNSLYFYSDVILPNIYSSTYILVLLTISAVSIGLSLKEVDENNLSFGIFFIFVSVVSMFSVVVLLLFVVPLNIPKCPCKDNFYGEFCELTCINPNGNGISAPCNGHGVCQNGCVCEFNFKGEYCDLCINKYNYSTNCTTCMNGYSELDDCTKCEAGRDIKNNCEVCLEDAYFDDPNNIYNTDSCTVCKPFYYRPSASIERGSYNEYLQFGETCQPCKRDANGDVCNGHGTCQHFWTTSDGGTIYESLSTQKILGEDANGDCICDDGYAAGVAGTCEKIPGYDFENTESICNGHGEAFITYKQKTSAIYSIFDKLVCKCDTNFVPTYLDSELSCSKNSTDNTCVYGFYKDDNNNNCKPCPGGGFLQGCNAIRGAGTCSATGICTCFVSYDQNSGGYSGFDCKSCANRNFYKVKDSKRYRNNPSAFEDPEKCLPCFGAVGPELSQSCGTGYCITSILLQEFSNNNAMYNTFKLATGSTMTLADLENEIGECICNTGSSIDSTTSICN